MTMPKRKRVVLTIQQKLKILEQLKKNVSQKTLADIYGGYINY